MYLSFAQRLAIALIGLLGIGCVAVSGFIPESNGNFSLTATDRQPHRSSLKLSAEVRERASVWCKTQGYEMIVVSETHSGNPLGNTAKIVFSKKRIQGQYNWTTRPAAETRNRLLGSGLIVSPDGHVVTWLGLVEGMSDIKAYVPKTRNAHSATLVDSDSKSGLALLKLNNWNSTLDTGKTQTVIKLASQLNSGQNVRVIGFPLEGLVGQDSMTTSTTIIIKQGNLGFTETSLSSPVSAGNLGCPVMLPNGNIVGIVAANHSPATNYHNNVTNLRPAKVINTNELKLFLERNKLRLDVSSAAEKAPFDPAVVQILSEK